MTKKIFYKTDSQTVTFYRDRDTDQFHHYRNPTDATVERLSDLTYAVENGNLKYETVLLDRYTLIIKKY